MPRRELERLLMEWRDAERRRDELEPGTAERTSAEAEVDRLRELYQREVELAESWPPDPTEESPATA
ncbi:MAG TPA: hypothetical protein VF802_05740 [Candidatus Limnocylindrales bacterium]